MKPNLRPSGWSEPLDPAFPGAKAFEVTDFTLFMYGLVRGDELLVGPVGKPLYEGLGVYELDGAFRLGIPYFEESSLLTRLSGLVTASKVEFSVPPNRKDDLQFHGYVVAVLQSAFRGRR